MADGDRTREDLLALVGATRIVEDPATIARTSRDTWVISVWRSLGSAPLPRPACVVRPETTAEVAAVVSYAAMEATLAAGGTISHHHGIGQVRREWLRRELGSAYPLLVALKHALDPLGIMNPGALLSEPVGEPSDRGGRG
jgi:FAD/FMN-containing dehydrogenase